MDTNHILTWRSSEARAALSPIQRYIYREALDHCYLEGSIPDDPLLLSIIVGMPQGEFDLEWPAVRGWFEPRLDGRMTPRVRVAPTNGRPDRVRAEKLKTSEDAQRQWFEVFWKEYWLHRGKLPAWASYRRKVTTGEQAVTVLRAVLIQRPAMLQREPDKRPHAATWLNQERWNDEVDQPRVETNPHEIFYPELP